MQIGKITWDIKKIEWIKYQIDIGCQIQQISHF